MPSAKNDKPRVICTNKKARHEFTILETLEAGMVLAGSEVKSLRAGRASLVEAYVRIEQGEAWLVDAHVALYEAASRENHEPLRRRKLLMSARELNSWGKKVREKGLTIVPLSMYFVGPWIKLEIGLGRGKKLHDKRADMKERDDRREMDRVLKRGQ